jgi:hypothetical protein
MEALRSVHFAARATRLLARLAIGVSLFALITPATAQSAPQPQVCKSALTNLISV